MNILVTTHILRFAISTAIIVEGLDKFFNLLVDWKIYLPRQIIEIWPFSPEAFLYSLGIVEITVGIIFLLSLRVGALLVAGLMAGIIFNLLLLGNFYNMILLNFIIGLTALACRSVVKPLEESDLIK